MDKKTLRDIAVNGKRVLVRVDFNVPLNEATGKIMDDSRIRSAIPTIDYLLDRNARVILCSHLGRPAGKPDPAMSLKVVAERLAQILRQPVTFLGDCIGGEVEKAARDMKDGEVILLENLRFHIEEEKNDPSFARKLAGLAEIYVNDAFGTCHRNHASIVGITKYLPAVAGLLLEKEVNSLGVILKNPTRPFALLLGGAKITDKIGMIENTLNKVDFVLIGGGMAATFLKAQSYEIGKSLIDGQMDTVKKLMVQAKNIGVRIVLPSDVLVTKTISNRAKVSNVSIENIPHDKRIVDIGALTISTFTKELEKCRTVFWNGPMGIYEIPRFSEWTRTVAKIISSLNATTIIGGGSTAEMVMDMKLADKMTFVSTGGGASLKFLGGEKLPGVEALLGKEQAVAI